MLSVLRLPTNLVQIPLTHRRSHSFLQITQQHQQTEQQYQTKLQLQIQPAIQLRLTLLKLMRRKLKMIQL